MKLHTFNSQNRAKEIYEGMYKAEFEYNANAHRQSMKMFETNYPSAANPAYNLSYTRYYAGEYEKQVSASNTTEVCYINTPVGLAAAHVTQNNTSEIFYLHTDHLGSIIGVSNSNQQKIYEVSYDAWGKKRAVEFWFPTNEPQTPPSWLWRGYTGHEHLPEFGLINMNARLYDPLLGRMLSPDNYVQDPTFSQNYNRYSYCFNNPLKYTDPDGNFIFTAAVLIASPFTGGASLALLSYSIGADIGMWQGGSLANRTMNPLKWDYGNKKTWGFMVAGAIVGGASGGAANAVATSGMVGANTAAIIVGSSINSMGTAMYTHGKTDVSVSFGAGSFNMTNGEFRGLWNWGDLSTGEKIGYSLGALANISDMGKTGDMFYNVEKKDVINHAAIKDSNRKPIISYGPGNSPKYNHLNADRSSVQHYGKMLGGIRGTNSYPIYGRDIPLTGVNTTMIKTYGKMLSYLSDNGLAPYSFAYSSCSTHAGLAMWFAGVPNLLIHPYTLQASVWLWNQGITPSLIQNSYYLTRY